tara:strand:+ start:1114 stop:1503 length:390 start_codon:yes stop_codon:yes gene_type:complete
METNMKKEKHSNDKISENTLHEILMDIKYSLNHLEDIEADNRAIIVKLVKQNNQIVKFLSQIEIEDISVEYDEMIQSPVTEEESEKLKKFETLKDILDTYLSKQKDLKEFEKELKKYKAEITPGTIGES